MSYDQQRFGTYLLGYIMVTQAACASTATPRTAWVSSQMNLLGKHTGRLGIELKCQHELLFYSASGCGLS